MAINGTTSSVVQGMREYWPNNRYLKLLQGRTNAGETFHYLHLDSKLLLSTLELCLNFVPVSKLTTIFFIYSYVITLDGNRYLHIIIMSLPSPLIIDLLMSVAPL